MPTQLLSRAEIRERWGGLLRGSLDLLGPSTKRAVAALLAGTAPDQAGAGGDTNGAAMRIAPVGIAVALDLPHPATFQRAAVQRSMVSLVDQVEAASRLTHNTSIALAGAAAVAAAVSAGLRAGRAGSQLPGRQAAPVANPAESSR